MEVDEAFSLISHAIDTGHAARGSLPVCSTIDEAIDWANDFVAQIARS